MSYDSTKSTKVQAFAHLATVERVETGVTDSPLAYPDGFASVPTVDWLQFTLHVLPPEKRKLPDSDTRDGRIVRLLEQGAVDPVSDLLHLKSALIAYFGGGVPLPNGMNGYASRVAVLGTGFVCWNVDRLEMGVHVVLPSSALQRWAAISGVPVLDFLYDMRSRGAVFTRVDIAQDTDAVSMDRVIAAYENGLIVTKLQSEQVIDGRKRGKPAGKTLYVGNRSGRRYVRLYDKAAEQGVEGTWVRCEVEFKREHAQTAVDHLLSGADARELLLSTIDFRELDNPEVKRRSRCDWWQAWVEVAETVTFPVRKAAAAVADSMAWVVKAVVPTLALLCTYMGSTRWLETEIYEAAARVPAWKWDCLPPAIDTLWARAGGAA